MFGSTKVECRRGRAITGWLRVGQGAERLLIMLRKGPLMLGRARTASGGRAGLSSRRGGGVVLARKIGIFGPICDFFDDLARDELTLGDIWVWYTF